MRFSFSTILVLALAAESTVASAWFSKAGKLISYLFEDYSELPLYTDAITWHYPQHSSIALSNSLLVFQHLASGLCNHCFVTSFC